MSAIYTPFSFVLFYEVLLLVLAVPKSTTKSIRTQFEIVSLIVIRRVFKDIAELDALSLGRENFVEASAVLIDMVAGLAMFALVCVFYGLERSKSTRDSSWSMSEGLLESFVDKKKTIALLLSGLLMILAVVNLVFWTQEAYRVSILGAEAQLDVDVIFYKDLFTAMIFSDVLILLFSLSISNAYHLVFRNAGFIVSTILIRLSLIMERPYDVAVGLLGMLFGILVLAVYNYFLRVGQSPLEVGAGAGRRPAVEA